ncbi:MAG: hemolysin III family protein [Nitrospirae bacterium]|jgi:hemolysin III|nr:hemolysin III family protein [Nitrospirota bacterium]
MSSDTTEGKIYKSSEEIIHGITHGIGILFSLIGMIILLYFAIIHGTTRHIISSTIYGVSLLLLYTASTLYHSIQNPKTKNILRQLDHTSIYILIAGSYTPFTLVNLRGIWGWTLFVIVWSLASAGIIMQLTPLRKWKIIRMLIYIVMGWTAITAIKPLSISIPHNAFILIVSGGIIYTAGIVFYLWRRIPFNHAIWHVFVLAGSTMHYFAVLSSLNHSL